MSEYKPLGGRIVTPPFIFLTVLALIGLYFLGVRFVQGLGAATNLNEGYAFGLWVVYDIVVGTGLACGGYVLAITVYVLNKGQYHPLVRPAVTASMLGYALGGFGAVIDMGRYWQGYTPFLPWHMNFNSVMLEVSLCVTIYVSILILEFSPPLLEKMGAKNLLKSLNKVLFFLIALGVLLPTMHQSSLGSLLIIMGDKIHPLWQSLHFQPLLAIITAAIMGFSIVVFEGSMSTVGFRRPSETPLLASLSKGVIGLLVVYLVARFTELIIRGKLGFAFAGDFYSIMFLLETMLFVIPLVILLSPRKRQHGPLLLIASVSMIFAGALYRFNGYLIGFDPGPGFSYFPSVPELMVTIGIVAFEIMAFLYLVKKLPVMHDTEHA